MFYAVQQSEHTETLVVGLFQKSQLTGKALEIDEMLEEYLTQLLKRAMSLRNRIKYQKYSLHLLRV